ncbi:MAG: acyl carrier protein [Lachnospiraceae bacterium]|nr:acyl carrier protein [Lachnospiraceae bacterium]
MVLEKLTQLFREIFADENLILTLETSPNEIEEWDSLSQVLIVEEVEKTFQIKMDLDEVFKIKNVGDLVKIIEGKLIH